MDTVSQVDTSTKALPAQVKQDTKGFFARMFGFGANSDSLISSSKSVEIPNIPSKSVKNESTAEIAQHVDGKNTIELEFNHFKAHVEEKDRRWRLKSYKSCFVGSTAVSNLISAGVCADEQEALNLGNRLMHAGYFSHVHNVSYTIMRD